MRTYYTDVSVHQAIHTPSHLRGRLLLQTRLDIRGNYKKGLAKIVERYEAYFTPTVVMGYSEEEPEIYREDFKTIDELILFVKRYFVEDDEACEHEMN